MPGLNPERADIIVAGLAVAAEVLARLEARELDRLALRHPRGTSARAGARRRRRRRSRRSARAIGARVRRALPLRGAARDDRCRRSRCSCSTRSATRLGCAPDDRQTLADAALLHDVGYHINYDQHHKHSYHLIVHAELLGMTPDEQVVIANVARYHRGAAAHEASQLRRARQAAARAHRAAVGDPSRRRRFRPRARRRRRRRARCAGSSARIRITPSPAPDAGDDPARAVGREPEVAAARRAGGRAGGDRRRPTARVLSSDDVSRRRRVDAA